MTKKTKQGKKILANETSKYSTSSTATEAKDRRFEFDDEWKEF